MAINLYTMAKVVVEDTSKSEEDYGSLIINVYSEIEPNKEQ